MSSLFIKNGRVIDPVNNIDSVANVLVVDGVIAEVSDKLSADADKVIDAEGCWVMPGFIDLHVHLREPGQEKKETIATGTRAGAMGGFTSVCAMPNTTPVTDNEIMVTYIKYKAEKEGVINVLPIGAITKGQKGEELADIGRMAQAGACAISEDGRSVENASLMKTALKYSKMLNLPVFDHCEDAKLAGKGSMNAGDAAALLGLKGISNDSEEVIVSRDMILAGATGAKLHLCHISTKGSVDLIRESQARGIDVTAEATPHHFTLCDEDVPAYDSNFKMNPPLRSREDLKAIKEALRDDVISVIATDHAPHHIDDKNCEFAKAANGIIGLETAFPLAVTELVEQGYLTPSQLVEKMSANPAKILGIKKGQLTPGACADITIAKADEEYTIDVSKMVSKGKNTPFGGRKVKGKVLYTIVGGNVVVEDGNLVEEAK